VRLSGQDSGRGTFSQRHSVLVDQQTEDRYQPLSHVAAEQESYEVIDSMLSEAAVLGFEYGYSLAEPNALVLWEAQFGDFANGAQVIIDQFLSNGEAKWLRMSGLVMLLPHGLEGQGPEHSSARLERYLQLCAEDNMQVANCTTPGNYFHILRRQIHRDFRKPLILMTPKSLLRHKACVSSLEDFGPGSSFHRVLYENKLPSPAKKAKRLILCSGKVFYDLVEKREALGADDVHILRLEQLYPFPTEALLEELKPYTHVDQIIWCQEEPKNMGAWLFVQDWLEACFSLAGMKNAKRPLYVGRPPAAAAAPWRGQPDFGRTDSVHHLALGRWLWSRLFRRRHRNAQSLPLVHAPGNHAGSLQHRIHGLEDPCPVPGAHGPHQAMGRPGAVGDHD